MFAEGESELRGIVVQSLESCGFLNKIKAELRSGVFLALSEEGNIKKKVPLFNKQLENFINTNDGNLVLSLVREFLEFFNLNFTLSVFDPEVSSSYPYSSRKCLCEVLNLKETEFDGPILSALLKTQSHAELNDVISNKVKEARNSSDLKEKNILIEKSTLNSSEKQKKDFFDEKNQATADISSFSVDLSSKKGFNFCKLDEKDVLKDQSIDNFFDDPVPLEKTNILSSISTIKEQKSLMMSDRNNQKKNNSAFLIPEKGGTSAINDEIAVSISAPEKENSNILKKISPISLLSEKGNLSPFSELPVLIKQDKESLAIALDYDVLASGNMNASRKDVDPDLTEESSDQQINSEESIEEDIEEFSAGLDDLLNSSLSLGDEATSDQTISQTSVVDGVDHFETCNAVN